MPLNRKTIAVVGATGAVGKEMLTLLARDGVPASDVTAYASARSVGATLAYADTRLTVVDTATLDGQEAPALALFAASSDVARRLGPALVERGSVVVDNSSAFRMADGVELIVPEVNGSRVAGDTTPRLIANPNCSTIIMLVGATPIREAFGCERIIASTYQAASGAGIAAMDELRTQTAGVLAGKDAVPSVFREPCAFNVFSHDSDVDPETGMNVEESKMIEETRKIWGDDAVDVRPTCVRVPVLRAHCESLHITTTAPATLAGVRAALIGAPGLRLVDDREANDFPTPLKASGGEDVLVGRVRVRDTHSVECFVAGDQLLKGAAQNAVQIARLVFGA
ncbi:MAG: aspartate-semialdehyde dehydrogenase [Planctomycetota bacterium]